MSGVADPIEASPDPWPITVVARWHDPGYSDREDRWWLYLAVAALWVFGVSALAGRPEPGFLAIAGLVLAMLAWHWVRRSPTDIDMILDSDGLRIGATAERPAVNLERDHAGWLFAAETGLDWRERLLLLTDGEGHEVARLRARQAAVQIPDASQASESWWSAHMPAGTTPRNPPSSLPVTSLLGAWWPREERRTSVRGNMGWRRPWKEAELRSYQAWDRRQRRLNSAVVAAVCLFVLGLSIVGGARWSPATLIGSSHPPSLAWSSRFAPS